MYTPQPSTSHNEWAHHGCRQTTIAEIWIRTLHRIPCWEHHHTIRRRIYMAVFLTWGPHRYNMTSNFRGCLHQTCFFGGFWNIRCSGKETCLVKNKYSFFVRSLLLALVMMLGRHPSPVLLEKEMDMISYTKCFKSDRMSKTNGGIPWHPQMTGFPPKNRFFAYFSCYAHWLAHPSIRPSVHSCTWMCMHCLRWTYVHIRQDGKRFHKRQEVEAEVSERTTDSSLNACLST